MLWGIPEVDRETYYIIPVGLLKQGDEKLSIGSHNIAFLLMMICSLIFYHVVFKVLVLTWEWEHSVFNLEIHYFQIFVLSEPILRRRKMLHFLYVTVFRQIRLHPLLLLILLIVRFLQHEQWTVYGWLVSWYGCNIRRYLQPVIVRY